MLAAKTEGTGETDLQPSHYHLYLLSNLPSHTSPGSDIKPLFLQTRKSRIVVSLRIKAKVLTRRKDGVFAWVLMPRISNARKSKLNESKPPKLRAVLLNVMLTSDQDHTCPAVTAVTAGLRCCRFICYHHRPRLSSRPRSLQSDSVPMPEKLPQIPQIRFLPTL